MSLTIERIPNEQQQQVNKTLSNNYIQVNIVQKKTRNKIAYTHVERIIKYLTLVLFSQNYYY